MQVDAEVFIDGSFCGEISFDRDEPPKEIYISDCAETKRFIYVLKEVKDFQ